MSTAQSYSHTWTRGEGAEPCKDDDGDSQALCCGDDLRKNAGLRSTAVTTRTRTTTRRTFGAARTVCASLALALLLLGATPTSAASTSSSVSPNVIVAQPPPSPKRAAPASVAAPALADINSAVAELETMLAHPKAIADVAAAGACMVPLTTKPCWQKVGLGPALAQLNSEERTKLLSSDSLGLTSATPPNSSCLSGVHPPCCPLQSYLSVWNGPAHSTRELMGLFRKHNLTSLAFFGDSVGGQYWRALREIMVADGVSCTNSSRITDRFPELKAAVPWATGYTSINCDGIEMMLFGKYPHEWLNTSEDAIRALTSPTFAHVADVISFNTGFHINSEPKYRSALEYVVPLLERFAVLPGKVVIFRGTTAQHFAGSKSGDYEKRSGESCDSTRIPKEPSFRDTVLKSFGQSRLGVMMVEQLWELTQERFDMHIGKPGDCTHFCYCPSFWRGIFSNLYLQLEQHLYEKATVEGPAAAYHGV